MRDILFPREIGRISFVIRLILLVIAVTLIVVTIPLPDSQPEHDRAIWLIAIPFAIFNLLFITLPRIRDIGLPTWAAVFALVPYLNGILFLFLAFAPKQKSFLGTSLGSSAQTPPTLQAPDQTPEPKPTTVAGSTCSLCGDKLMLSRDGVINEDGNVVCNDCLTGVAEPT